MCVRLVSWVGSGAIFVVGETGGEFGGWRRRLGRAAGRFETKVVGKRDGISCIIE